MLLRPGHILVADHQGNLDRFVCNVVGQEHWLIQHVETAVELSELILAEKPDILVINAHLPDLQIHELSNDLDEKFGSTKPFVILAISKDPEPFLQRGIQWYVDEVLIAPFYGVELLTKIHNFVRLRHGKPVLSSPHSEEQKPVALPRPRPAKAQSLARKEPAPFAKKPTPPVEAPVLSFSRPATPLKKPAPAKTQKDAFVAAINPAPVNEGKTSAWSIRKKMTLLLVCLKGLEGAVDDLEPGQSIQRIQQVYKILSDEVSRLGGRTVSKYGDSMAFVFSNSAIISNHRISALQAAMQLQLSALFFSEKLGQMSDRVNISCVLHTSMMTLGASKGQEGDTTVIGSALPLAMRLLDFCPANQIIATADCYADVADHICIAEEFVLNHDENEAKQIRFALISGLNASDYVLRGVGIFRATA